MKGAVAARKALQGSKTERMKLLQGTKENNKIHRGIDSPHPSITKEMRYCGQTFQVRDREA